MPGTSTPCDRLTTKEARKLMGLDPEIERAKHKTPVQYTDAIAMEICYLMAEGYMLPEICEMPGFPSVGGVMRWQVENPIFSFNLSRAREALGDRFAYKVKQIAENTTFVTAQPDRVSMDGYKWLAAKHYPKQYGDKTTTEVQGSVTIEQRQVIDISSMSPADVAALERILLATRALPAPIDH